MVKTKAAPKKLADESFAVRANDLFQLGAKKDVKTRWIKEHDLWMAEITGQMRVITPVVLSGLLQWCDAVTGSVYSGAGRCASSDVLAIKMSTIYKDDGAAAGHLMRLDGKGENNLEVMAFLARGWEG